MTRTIRLGRLMATLAILATATLAPAAVTADDLLLVVNKRQPVGRELAEEYAKLRGVPEGRIVEVDVPDLDEIERPFYDRSIAEVVRREINQRNLRDKATCVVLFYGVPLRIREAKRTLPEQAEVKNVLEPAARALADYLGSIATKSEAIAKRVSPGFAPPTVAPGSPGTEAFRARLVSAERAVAAALPGMTDGAARESARADFAAAQREVLTLPALPMLRPAPASAPTVAQADVDAMIARRDDAESRRRLRTLVASSRNAFQLLALVEAQVGYLAATEAESSVDSELSCLWLPNYPLTKWVSNPFHHAGQAAAFRPQMVRTARIDGPTPQVARRIFNASVVVERRGLEGDVVLDARGKHGATPIGSYDWYDASIRKAMTLVSGIEGLTPITDDAEPLLKDGTSAKAALYCGWYKVRDYQKTVAMVPGGVAFHVASYEAISLHSPSEKGWCRGLMLDGADVTLGPVSEPYLIAFPPADEFFGLLLTGKPTLVEAYWATIPVTSWRMVLIGDPLYRPFAARPALSAERLSPSLQAVLK